MNEALYFPIHRAKVGEIAGVGHLSPKTRTRVRPVFEVQMQREDDDTPLEEHLSRVAHQLLEAWGSRYPLFVDFSQFGPDDRTADGKHSAEYFFRCLRQQSMLGIPMTGPESVRGPGYGYVDAIARIASDDARGAALRLPFEEFSASDKLEHAINDSLRALRLEPAAIDLFLDFETLALLPAESRAAPGMVSVLVDVLRKYGEFGVSGHVRPPARGRLSTAGEHVLWRAPRKDYIELSDKVVASQDFDPALAAWGTGVLLLCARYGRGKGGPTSWYQHCV